MRITHVIRSDGWAGVERHVLSLALEQAATGHTVHVIGGDPAVVSPWVQHDLEGHSPVRTLLQTVRALERADVPDVLHVHMTAAELAAAVSRRMRGVPVVSTRHFARTRGANALSRAIARMGARRIDAQIAVSQFVADHIEGESTVILPGVQSPEPRSVPRERARTVLVAQRLEPEKETDLAVRAFDFSGIAALGWRLDIAGDGSLREPLVALATRLGVADAVDFLGHRADVPDLMATAGLLLAPGRREGYGLTVVEAMSAGLPVIAAAGGGHLETAGLVLDAALFAPGDVSHAGRLLRELVADLPRRNRYGRALQVAQREALSLSAQAAATEAVYRSVL